MANTGYSAVKQVASAYWYKINGKNTTKAAYNAYKNKPGGDEGGKSTNDPDANGNKAKIKKDRSNNAASKKSTALTKAQTTAKGGVSPPLKQKVDPDAPGTPGTPGYEPPVKRSDLDAKGKAIWDKNHAKKGKTILRVPGKIKKKTKKSPLEFGWKDALDAGQIALTAAGTIPGVGIIADGVNTAVSGGRAAYAGATGDKKGVKEHTTNMALNAAMMIPVVGQGVASTKLAYATGKQALKTGGKKLAKKIGEKAVIKTTKAGAQKSAELTSKPKEVKNKKKYAENYKGKSNKSIA